MPKRSTLKLTKRIVEKLKAEDKDAIYWDGELAGFGVRVHATTETDIPEAGVSVFSFSAPFPVHSRIVPRSPRNVISRSPRFAPGVNNALRPRIAAAAALRIPQGFRETRHLAAVDASDVRVDIRDLGGNRCKALVEFFLSSFHLAQPVDHAFT